MRSVAVGYDACQCCVGVGGEVVRVHGVVVLCLWLCDEHGFVVDLGGLVCEHVAGDPRRGAVVRVGVEALRRECERSCGVEVGVGRGCAVEDVAFLVL